MKKFCAFAATLSILATGQVLSQYPNPRGETTLDQVTIEFGRPSTRGRDVLALMPAGSYWRMGADLNTTLESGVDLKFGDQSFPKGSYNLLAHLKDNGEDWELVICEDIEEGFRPGNTVAVAPLELTRGAEEVDPMTIELRAREGQSELLLSWGFYRLSALFSQAD